MYHEFLSFKIIPTAEDSNLLFIYHDSLFLQCPSQSKELSSFAVLPRAFIIQPYKLFLEHELFFFLFQRTQNKISDRG